jgi:hypothetical protein
VRRRSSHTRATARFGGWRAVADEFDVERQRAETQLVGEIPGGGDREASGDVGAGVAGDPVRELLEVDKRDREQLIIERDREVLVERLAQPADQLAAPGDRAVRFWNSVWPLEVNPKVMLGVPVPRSVLCCGLVMSLLGSATWSLSR